jgi:hypothetical protein
MDELVLVIFAIAITMLGIVLFFYTIYLFAEHFYGYFFNKTLFVHVYRKRLELKIPDVYFLRNNFSYYKKLNQKQQNNFNHRVANFILKYPIIGKEGFEITQEVKIMIAATHVLLTFGFRKYLLPKFDKIILYPNIYYSSHSDDYHKGEYNVRMKAVVFSWFHFQEGFDFGNSNLNLGIHEFTHAIHYNCLTSEDASAVIFARFYRKILEEINQPMVQQKLINSNYFRIYAFTNSFEFLAVIMEHYFETPDQFKIEFPSLFKKVGKMLGNQL